MSNSSKKAVSATIAALVGLGLVSNNAIAASGAKEKCYGVVKAGKNDCGTSKHACAGQAKADNDGGEWLYVSKGICERIGGSLTSSDS